MFSKLINLLRISSINLVIFTQTIIYFIIPSRKKIIIPISSFDSTQHKFILIFAGFSRNIDTYTGDHLKLFKSRGGYIVYVNNHEKFDRHCLTNHPIDVYIDNRNSGWDFSMYKTATQFVYKNINKEILPNKIIYANDSVFYLKTENTDFIDGLLDVTYDFTGMFENSGRGRYHVSSWLVSMSKEMFISNKIRKFWRRHVPLKNKHHAIHSGEHRLTKTVFEITNKVKVLYNNSVLLELLNKHAELDSWELKKLLAPSLTSLAVVNVNRNDLKYLKYFKCFLERNLWLVSPHHIFNLFLVKEENFPFIKKDIFWHERLDYSMLSVFYQIINTKFSENIAIDLQAYYIRKGRLRDQGFKGKILSFFGLRA